MEEMGKQTKYQERLDNVLKRVRKKDQLYNLFGKPNEIILNPKNKLEKKYGEAFLSYAEDYLELDMSLEYDELGYTNIEESLFIEYIVNTVNAYNMTGSEKQVKRVINDYSTPEDLAIITYEQKIIMDTLEEDALKIILYSCGYDPTNNDDIKDFTEVYKIINRIAKEDNERITTGDMIDFIYEANFFHQLHNNVMLGEYFDYKKLYLS